MRGVVGSIGHKGGLLSSLLTLLLVFRLLIPAGYMIAPDHEGRPGLALCAVPAPAVAEAALHGGHDDHPVDSAPSGPAERPCAFAALAAPPLPPAPPAVPPHLAAVAPLDLPAVADFPRVAPASPPPPARGPPLPV
ncbi:MAG TPA: DUF2946 family protein [Allosphingosinicella sp.]|nr:DUF2946 family protein [Allosphingosinicella sp.]